MESRKGLLPDLRREGVVLIARVALAAGVVFLYVCALLALASGLIAHD